MAWPKAGWREDEVAEFRRLLAGDLPMTKIAEQLGRSVSNVWRMHRRLELGARHPEAPPKPEPLPPPRPIGRGRTLPPLPSLAGMEDTPCS